MAATRIPWGHPEGYFEAFANIYAGAIDAIRRHIDGTPMSPADYDSPPSTTAYAVCSSSTRPLIGRPRRHPGSRCDRARVSEQSSYLPLNSADGHPANTAMRRLREGCMCSLEARRHFMFSAVARYIRPARLNRGRRPSLVLRPARWQALQRRRREHPVHAALSGPTRRVRLMPRPVTRRSNPCSPDRGDS